MTLPPAASSASAAASGVMGESDEETATFRALEDASMWREHVGVFAVPTERVVQQFSTWIRGNCTGKLDLRRCGLVSLPWVELGKVASRITWLIVSENSLTNISGAFLARCTALTGLECRNNRLASLPAELGMCTALRHVNCTFNLLLSLPAEIGECTRLRGLHCGGNRLLSLPAAIGACTALSVLECGHNQLTELPDEIGKCTKLQRLFCSNNKLANLPVCLGWLGDLSTLKCRANPLAGDTPRTLDALRAAACPTIRAVLLFCHEAKRRDRDYDDDRSTNVGDLALDNVREIAHFIAAPPPPLPDYAEMMRILVGPSRRGGSGTCAHTL